MQGYRQKATEEISSSKSKVLLVVVVAALPKK